MQVSPEITFHGIDHSDYNEDYIRDRVARLNRLSDDIISCRTVVEQPHRTRHTGNTYRVRIDLTMPGRQELVVDQEEQMEPQKTLRTIISHAFDIMERQIKSRVPDRHIQHNQMGPEQGWGDQPHGIIVRMFKEDGYGFIKTEDGREFYMHQNSVLEADFSELTVGTEVRFSPELGEKGPQASSVHVESSFGRRATDSPPEDFEPPLGWEK